MRLPSLALPPVRVTAGALCALVLSLAPLTAQEAPSVEIVSPEAQAEWNAIGRVNIAGYQSRQMCSGVLIAPNAVLTAAHCIFKGARLAPADEVVFAAGWRGGETVAASNGSALTVHPDFLRLRPEAGVSVNADLAVITLAEALPVPPLPVAPFPFDANAPQHDLEIVGYRADRPHIASHHRNCRAVEWRRAAFATNCEVARGTSGAPVLSLTERGVAVVGVISAARLGGSLAAAPYAWLQEHVPAPETGR